MTRDVIRGFRLGDRIRFSAVLKRIREEHRRTWMPSPQEGEGVVVGHRVVKNGTLVQEGDWDEFSGRSYSWVEFKQTGAIPCLLVAIDMRRAHVRVPFDAIIPGEGS